MGNNTFQQVFDPFPKGLGTAKANFTSYQDIAGIASDNGSLPKCYPGDLRKGTKLQMEAFGEFSTTGTPTLSIGGIFGATPAAAGGTAFAQSAAITTGSAAAAWFWHWNAWFVVTQTGTSGQMVGGGILDLATSLTAFGVGVPCPVTAGARTVTINTDAINLWGLGAAWGTASASNTITPYGFRVENMNAGMNG